MSVGVDKILGQLPGLPDNFAYLREPMSAIPRGMERGGMILRSFLPEAGRPKTLIPFFALAKTPPDNSRPYILRLAEAANKAPRDFIKYDIIEKFVNQWVTLAVDFGILMEPHGQNLMLELDSQKKFTGRFVHRDLGGFNIDLDFIQKTFGLKIKNLPSFSGDLAVDYYQADHFKNMRKGLYTYFGDGALYAFESQWEIWARRGWLGGDTAPFDAKQLMLDSLRKALEARSGRPHSVNDAATLAPLVEELRRQPRNTSLSSERCRKNLTLSL
jgi:hypothetical protein